MTNPKISILMNCYNGEKYLREAVDSVYAQSFKDWEIVFIDNQSEDSSFEIVKSYDSNIKYFKTPQLMSLGEARKWGIQKCLGQYLCILDVDNYYYPSFLHEMYSEIKSLDDFIMVYCGYKKISTRNNKEVNVRPKEKQGCILKQLLYQFDIDPNGTITDLTLLKQSGLSFDPKIKVSEEYCLYMQLAAKYKMKAIDAPLFCYRWHDANLTVKHISCWGWERKYTLDCILSKNSLVKKDLSYKYALKEAYARGIYYEARFDMFNNNRLLAIKKLFTISSVSWRYMFLLIIAMLPSVVWKRIHHEYL